jgi:uncharacterized protein (TIGR00369 family)
VSLAVEFYFDFSSPYSYLAVDRLEEICARSSAELLWHPILMGPILKQLGKVPLFLRPGEGEYARRDLARLARHLELPLKFPQIFPVNGLSACRGFAYASDAGKGAAYCRRVLEACWAQGQDAGDLLVLRSVALELGLDPEEFLQSLTRPQVKEWLRGQTDDATRRGVFGAPTFFVGQEMFYGQDRLFMVEEALSRLHAPEVVSSSTAFNRWFGIRCVTRDAGRAEYEMQVTPGMLNRRGVAHGGAVCSLLDTALGAAVVSGIDPEEWCATLELSIQFRDPMRSGRVVGRGRMVKRGRRAAFAEGEIVDGSGKVLAVAHGTWYIWPAQPDV